MKEQTDRINRNSNLIKGFMAIVVMVQVAQFYQTRVIDLGSIAGAVGFLSLLRGLLLSPVILAAPIKNCFTSNITFSQGSIRYFILALILIMISAL